MFQGNIVLRVLNLSMNGLGNDRLFAVADIIKNAPKITHLDVTYNRIGKPGAQVIGKALEVNEVLKVFKVKMQCWQILIFSPSIYIVQPRKYPLAHW